MRMEWSRRVCGKCCPGGSLKTPRIPSPTFLDYCTLYQMESIQQERPFPCQDARRFTRSVAVSNLTRFHCVQNKHTQRRKRLFFRLRENTIFLSWKMIHTTSCNSQMWVFQSDCHNLRHLTTLLFVCLLKFVFVVVFWSLQPRPSFLSLDEDGRVLRYDSFSKVLSAG